MSEISESSEKLFRESLEDGGGAETYLAIVEREDREILEDIATATFIQSCHMIS